MAENPPSGFTLGSLLGEPLANLEGLVRAAAAAHGMDRGAWTSVGHAVATALGEIEGLDLFEVFAWGFAKAEEFHGYKDPTKHPRDEKAIVYLGARDLSADLHPVVTIRTPPLSGLSLRFTIELTAELKAVAVSVTAAHITRISLGACELSAVLKYGETVLRRSLKPLKIDAPGAIRFADPGIAIP